jgi:3-hydroxybutyryl-CoA dehydrogenase
MNPENVRNIAIFGAGVMGNSIAQAFAEKGFHVRLWSRSQRTLDRALTLIQSNLETMVKSGRVTDPHASSILDHIHPTRELADAAGEADFALETIAENPEAKKELFSNLNQLCSQDTILSSNTSGLDVFNLVEIDHPDRMVITHWFSPATVIPLVEVVPGEKTSQATIDLTVRLLESLDRKPIVLKKFVPAFIVNRIQNAINRAVLEMLDNDWASPEDIDIAVKNTLGIRLPVVGVAQVLDFNGLDLIQSINQRLGIKSAFIEKKVRQGHLGAKTSRGIYDYGSRSEAEIQKKRDDLYLSMLEHLKKINAFEPV